MKQLRRILDTSVLISHWHRCRTRAGSALTPRNARKWAQGLVDLHDTNAIVTPVYIEFVAGVQNENELRCARAFLNEFESVDEGRILKEDWDQAQRLAARVPRHGKRRQLGDCLIRAIAIRLRFEVRSQDLDFPK